MIHRDELRIVAEMGTFTQADLARECEISPQWASVVFDQFMRAKLVERVRVGKSWLYALTERGKRLVERLPAIDPEERCLPISFDGITPEGGLYYTCCPDWSQFNNVLVDAVMGLWKCPHCDSLHWAVDNNSRWNDIPF